MNDGLIGFAHPVFRFADEFDTRGLDYPYFEARNIDELHARLADVSVLVISHLWQSNHLDKAPRLRLIQACSSGTDQFQIERLRERGIYLANARGVNAQAVGEHCFALLLSLSRRLTQAHEAQQGRLWRSPACRIADREQELSGKTLLIIGLGAVGKRIAAIACALGMRVIGVRRSRTADSDQVERTCVLDELDDVLPSADVVVLACPLTQQTTNLISRRRLSSMKPSAYLINISRGEVVDEASLAECLLEKRLAGAGLDCFSREPLTPESTLWHLDNVIITPHVAGNTQNYECRVIDMLVENLKRLNGGARPLLNQIV